MLWILLIASHYRTATVQAISGLANSAKVYKGYSSCEDAHIAWEGFIKSGRLPIDVAVSLGSRPYPTPPILPAPHVLSSPTTPQHAQVSNHHIRSRVPQVLRIVNAVRLPLLDSRLLIPPGLETASMPLRPPPLLVKYQQLRHLLCAKKLSEQI